MDEDSLSVEAQLAVLRTKMDQLIELNRTRGQDHEERIRKLEERKFPLPTISVLLSLVAIVLAVIMQSPMI